MAASAKSSGDKKSSAAPSNATKTADGTKKKADETQSQDPLPTAAKSSTSTSGRFLLLQLFLAIVTGAVLGGYFTAYMLESEYQNIVTKLQSDHQSSLQRVQTDYVRCQSNLSDEKQSNEEAMARLRIRADQNLRSFQQKVEQYVTETNQAYKLANLGLEKASSHLQSETEKCELRVQAEAEKCESRVQAEAQKYDVIQQDLSQAETRTHAIRNSMNQMRQSLETSEEERAIFEKKFQHAQRELDEAEDELDRRDLERAECDEHHRNMLTCRESLRETLNELGRAKEAGENPKATAPDNNLREELEKTTQSLATSIGKQEALQKQVDMLIYREDELEQENNELTKKVDATEHDVKLWEYKVATIKEKVGYRNEREVLEEYGVGPYHVKINLGFENGSQTESILVELAPLHFMPHTIKVFLDMVKKKAYHGGTFIISRKHILVGGPIDVHDKENNQQLEDRMLDEGYFPNGSLLFGEYTPEYPHAPFTIGFNQIGGPIFYINTQDNDQLHGDMGDQQKKKEGDPCFAKVIEGFDVIERISNISTNADDSLESPVYITGAQVLRLAS